MSWDLSLDKSCINVGLLCHLGRINVATRHGKAPLSVRYDTVLGSWLATEWFTTNLRLNKEERGAKNHVYLIESVDGGTVHDNHVSVANWELQDIMVIALGPLRNKRLREVGRSLGPKSHHGATTER